MLSDDPEKSARQWASWTNARRAAWLLNFHQSLTANDNELAKKLDISAERIAETWRDYLSLKHWADYEAKLNSILDRDLVADVKAVKLFDNIKDPRDPSNHPEPPEKFRDQAAQLWPFK